ncbi:hypothetical protein [Actinocorallia herbida]|nr:hypothetical protein [Actinocorallia herbida]
MKRNRRSKIPSGPGDDQLVDAQEYDVGGELGAITGLALVFLAIFYPLINPDPSPDQTWKIVSGALLFTLLLVQYSRLKESRKVIGLANAWNVRVQADRAAKEHGTNSYSAASLRSFDDVEIYHQGRAVPMDGIGFALITEGSRTVKEFSIDQIVNVKLPRYNSYIVIDLDDPVVPRVLVTAPDRKAGPWSFLTRDVEVS